MRRRTDELARRAAADRRILDALMSLLVESDDLIRWRAIETLGQTAAVIGESDLEPVRELVRRLLWWMNEESGANVRHAPEAIGEIVVSVPPLIEEYASILASFLDEPFFRRGVHWSLSRIAGVSPEALSDCVEELAESLSDEDPHVRAHAASALAAMHAAQLPDEACLFASDVAPVQLYDFGAGNMSRTTVAQIAEAVVGATT